MSPGPLAERQDELRQAQQGRSYAENTAIAQVTPPQAYDMDVIIYSLVQPGPPTGAFPSE
ncbi:hypothetical protein ACWDTT_36565 [Streptosporangium sandarakinum]|uniref:hypothetical protein n=1 Tax=Streptosporangium sandarakinum TaxID=1260955 RepID=UPI003D8A1104